jgi:PAS domain S-box-containing protein
MDLFRLFFEESSDALIAVNIADGRLHSVNKSFTALTGYSREEIEGESINILNAIFPEDHHHELKLDLSLIQTPGFYNDIVLSTRDGQRRYLTVKVKHADYHAHKLALCVLSDDTERQLLIRDLATKHYSLETAYLELEKVHQELKSTQDKMFQASKLVALGELAAGISHELNQPLTGVKGFAQEILECLKEKAPDKDVEKLSREIITQADKMASLLSHLRGFAREEQKALKPSANEDVNLNTVFNNVGLLFHRQLESKNITLKFKDIQKNIQISSLEHPTEQVLINLIANARDAILEKRKIKDTFKGEIKISVEEQTDSYFIRIQDNGCGIEDTIKDHIFNPFFTTKDPDKGMGLGLSLSYSIAHRFGAILSLENSSSKHGTTFLIEWPKYKAQRKVA